MGGDPDSEKGSFYRSDHFEFAKQGVPALNAKGGIDYVGQSLDYGKARRDDYTKNDYHKPSDEVKPGWNLDGAAEDLQLLMTVGYEVAQGELFPEWKPGTEFRAVPRGQTSRPSAPMTPNPTPPHLSVEPVPVPVLPNSVAWGAWPVVRPVGWVRIWAGAGAYWAILGVLTIQGQPRISGNVTSRFMSVESLVERQTLAIERSPILAWSGSPDVVRFGDHLYSDKPPVLPALATPVSAGLRLAGVRMGRSPREFVASNFALTWVVVGLASAGTLASLRALLQAVAIPAWAADLATVAFGLGSPLLSYGVTFNNHSVAAGCIAGAWALTLVGSDGRRPGRRAFSAGLLAGLAATIDLPIGALTVLGVGVIQMGRDRWGVGSFLAGLLGPILLHVALQSAVTGSPLPAEFYPQAFEYPGSYWSTPEGRWREPGPRWEFGLDFLVGRSGAFTVFPVLWFGMAGLLAAALAGRESPLAVYRPVAVVVGGSFLVLVGYYVWGVRRTDFAGASWGTRHLLAASVLVDLFAVIGLVRLRGRTLAVAQAGFCLALAVGGIYAQRGMVDPWTRVETRAATDPLLRVIQVGALSRSGAGRDEQGRARPGVPR